MNRDKEKNLQEALDKALEAVKALKGLLDDLAAQAIEAQELADRIGGNNGRNMR